MRKLKAIDKWILAEAICAGVGAMLMILYVNMWAAVGIVSLMFANNLMVCRTIANRDSKRVPTDAEEVEVQRIKNMIHTHFLTYGVLISQKNMRTHLTKCEDCGGYHASVLTIDSLMNIRCTDTTGIMVEVSKEDWQPLSAVTLATPNFLSMEQTADLLYTIGKKEKTLNLS